MKLYRVPAGTPAMLIGDRVLRVWETEGARTYEREDLVLDQVILHNQPDWNTFWGYSANTAGIMERMVGMGRGKMFFRLGGDPSNPETVRTVVAVDRSNVEVL